MMIYLEAKYMCIYVVLISIDLNRGTLSEKHFCNLLVYNCLSNGLIFLLIFSPNSTYSVGNNFDIRCLNGPLFEKIYLTFFLSF